MNIRAFNQPPLGQSLPVADSPDRRHHRISNRTSQNINPNTSLEADTASWTSSIAHHCKNGRLSKAISQFNRMRTSEVEPNHITFITLFSGCAHFPSQGSLLGPPIHGYARKMGLDIGDVKVGTALIDMYSKFGEIRSARLSFDHMIVRNKVSWNTMINGYMRNGQFWDAGKLFDEMPERDAVSWTVLIDGFVKKGKFEEALGWFQEMQLAGTDPDFVTIVSVLSAVANIGTLGLGLWLHRFISDQQFKDNIRVNNSLIDMYCRCGCVEFARQVFDKMPERSLVSWNSIIVGLACNAYAEEALQYFHLMQKSGLKPDGVSFTGALTACSHAGLVEEGLKLFENMARAHKITPRIEHYGCVVDLYSRAGRLREAMRVVERMPMKPNEVVFGSLLAACRTFGEIGLAETVMDRIHDMDPNGHFNYVLLANIYASTGSWGGAGKVRRKMKDRGLQKQPGVSLIEIDCTIHEFVAADRSHADAENIFAMLQHLSNEIRMNVSSCQFDFLEDFH
ncbi:LOW QUALITY PROTEIN: pentatricopeptide repeat-containing protein At1g05750, chloroplastic-like [Salvia miltiorrhiza]|uniref:LOW QUALITY PROTEIN: pentatricopeptide repeat-containing protein At1g05750, chloroplastic-like n=1 Tax=Salvia miltiorrhiza TaxID=226208 RepID=UPI0025AC736B|nr:LOW QUALITY PROTEIN: pentatricopeptide repeat-containing protein At1g05750, chloroplastic-like [Salvia miltiorrhiza]